MTSLFNNLPSRQFPSASIDQTGVAAAQHIAGEVIGLAHIYSALVPDNRHVTQYLLLLRDAFVDALGLGSVRADITWAYHRSALHTAHAYEHNRYVLGLEADRFWEYALGALWWALEPDAYREQTLQALYAGVKESYSVRVGTGK